MSLWRRLVTEAHRRSIWQVLGVYVIGGWIGYQVVLALHEGLALPEWVPPLAIVLFIIGLPIVVATAMVQEGPPNRGTFTARSDELTVSPEFATTPWDDVSPNRGVLQRHLTWRRSIIAGVAAFALLALAATGFVIVRTRGTLVAQGVLDERGVVVLADFATRNADPEIGAIVTEALRIDLQQSNILRLAERAQISGTLTRMQRDAASALPVETAREVAEREGWKAVLAGEIGQIGGSYVLTAELVTPDSARVLASFKSTAADSTVLLRAVDELSKEVRAKIGEQLATVRAAPPLERVSTSSLAALRKYADATRAYEVTGDQVRALELLNQAIALDSSFAMAWRRRGLFMNNLGMNAAQRDTSLTRAYNLRDRLSDIEAWLATASYEAPVRRNPEGAIEAYRRVLQLDPDHTVALNNLGNLLISEGRYEEAVVPLEHAVQANVANSFVFNNLVSAQFRLDRIEAAHATIAIGRERLPENLAIEATAFNVATSTGNWELGDSIARASHARATSAGNIQARINTLSGRARVAKTRGRLDEALKRLAELEPIFGTSSDARPAVRGVVTNRVDIILHVLGDTARARREIDAGIRRYDPESFANVSAAGYFLWAERFAALGRFDRADALVKRSLARAESAGVTVDAEGKSRAHVALYRGDPAPVLQTHKRLSEAGNCKICDLPWLGRAYELAGYADSARTAYEQFITTPQYNRLDVDADWRAFVLLRSAELHEAVGDTAKAIERYTEFVQLWQNADAALQPRVESVKTRIARLRGPG